MNITPFGDGEALERLGTRLKRARLRRNQTQQQLAELAGVTRSTYAKLEAGDGSVQLQVLARVLGLLGLVDGLGELVPDIAPPVDFDTVERLARRQRARPGKPVGESP
ncbi:MAG: helix-turn-helix transcriptional regulator [Opitutus sp.]|nr:helix-turn-helix transcriptional regulator [Opitutus sp.]MCS6247973.1 helix-turn-helix transcriptional regulator [Opitutus sp.]MCS6275360.1 helix-turn-helix transcriptional regulator [Opitutus sp.]MCS6276881.1 helix-turn-helix transcriptional regulator [Opitutus sp.]MCS6301470.1 helix-turn-helix transcriptional regulator [Opitutus sp.]